MPLSRLLTLASLSGVAAFSFALLGGGCSSETPKNDGPLGQTQVGLTLSTAGFVETTVFQGLKEPTVLRFASDGRVFVGEKGGKIWIYDSLTDQTPTLFANLADRVHDFWDRGLLGLALDPGFPAKPYVYVLYAYDGDPGGAAPKWGDGCPTPPGATADGCVISGRLSRFALNNDMAGAETVLVEGWRQQYPSHSIGQVEFGPDGALYASGGDGASFNFVDYGQDGNPLNPLGDPPVAVGAVQTSPSAEGGALRSQSVRRTDGPTLLNGSVIRIDPDTGLGLSDNPLAASTDENAKRIIAYGLRNPFRIASRPGKNELWVADVGWNNWEEVNRLPLGGATPLNFGWPCYEGAGKQAGYDGADLSLCESLYTGAGQTAPFFTYAHTGGVSASDGCGRGSSSVTGIAFYTGNSYPAAYKGAMFFSDYSRRCIYVMQQGAGGDPAPATARSFHVDADAPVFLTTGPGGDLFYAAINSGTIQRISYLQPAAAFTATPSTGQAPLIVNFDGKKSVKALPGDTLSYAWDLDGDGTFDDSDEAQPAYLYDAIGNYSVRLKITDQRSISSVSQPMTIAVTADPPPVTTPPEVFIDTPSTNAHWKVGDLIQFSGHATDAEDGDLPASALSWQIVIQHCPSGCHIHDLLSFDGVANGSFTAEDHEYPMHLELILTATDSSGQKRTARLELQPSTVSLVFDTIPSGLELVVGSSAQKTPFARRVIVGSENTVSAAATQQSAGNAWNFASWSDGLARSHTLPDVTAAARYVATYTQGGGLTAQYFDQLAFGGTPLTRIDPVVDFNWGNESPDPTLAVDTFSARWTGEVKADFAETYTFSTTSDDGVRLSVDGAIVIDHFNDHGPALDTGTIALTPGWHAIVLEYYEQGGGAQISLSWSSPSQVEQVVPQSHLRPGCSGGVCSSGMLCSADDLCLPKCDPAVCKGAKRCRADGVCVVLCSGVKCPVGDVCSVGRCIDACANVSCNNDQHCEVGQCVDNPPSGGGGAGGDGGAPPSSGGTVSIPPNDGGAAGSSVTPPGDAGAAGAPVIAPGDGGSSSEGGTPSITPGEGGTAGTVPSEAGTAGTAPSEAGTATIPGSAGEPTSGGDAPVGTAGGEGGAPASAGSSGSGGSPSGCSCTAAGAERAGSYGWLGAALCVWFVRRRKR